MCDEPVLAKIIIDEELLKELARDYLAEYYSKRLEKEWYTIKDLQYITGFGRTWVLNNIIQDPYIRNNGIAKRIGSGQKRSWRIDPKRIRPFLRRLFINADC